MIYMVAALRVEVDSLISKLNLAKHSDSPFSIYKNSHLLIIISGVGSLNCAVATSYLLSRYTKPKKIINFGIAGSNTHTKIGEIKKINKIVDLCTNSVYHLERGDTSISTAPMKIDNKYILKSDLVDMESSGFYQAAKRFLSPKDIDIYKIASDYLEPLSVDKDGVKRLIESRIEEICKVVL